MVVLSWTNTDNMVSTFNCTISKWRITTNNERFSDVIGNPFHITWCDSSIKVIIIFIIGYVMAITIYLSTKKNYRRREEHGSARWGNANEINKKYKQLPMDRNKLLTQNVCIGLNGKSIEEI